MLLAELEVRHSRAIAPTRRVAIGSSLLPVDTEPAWGVVLLAGVVADASKWPGVDDDAIEDFCDLLDDLEGRGSVAQPRLRHRLQRDVVGLDRSTHRLWLDGEALRFDIDDHARPVPQLLAAAYAANDVPRSQRKRCFAALRKALVWDGPLDDRFVASMSGDVTTPTAGRRATSATRALVLFGFAPTDVVTRERVSERFRELVWAAHPDHGGDATTAGDRMVALTEARRVLLRLAQRVEATAAAADPDAGAAASETASDTVSDTVSGAER